MKLIELTHKEFKELRKKQWIKQDGICPILKQYVDYKNMVFDHEHRTKAEKIGEGGKGLLRGVIHKQANSWEGKVTNAFKRYGLHKFNVSLPEALRNLACYIEAPPLESKYVHPNEREFKKLKKSEYNKIKKCYFKMYPNRKRMPKYPKSKKLTKAIGKIIEELRNKGEEI